MLQDRRGHLAELTLLLVSGCASGLLEEPSDLLTLPGNGVAFGVVLVVRGHISRSLDDAIEALREACGASDRYRSNFGQPVSWINSFDDDHHTDHR